MSTLRLSKSVLTLSSDIEKYILDSGDKVKTVELQEAFKPHSKPSIQRALTHAKQEGKLRGRSSDSSYWYYHEVIAERIDKELDKLSEEKKQASIKRGNIKAAQKAQENKASAPSVVDRILSKCVRMKTVLLPVGKQSHYRYVGE